IELAKARKPHVFERQRPDGITIEVRGAPVEGGGFVTTYIDVTERRRNEARIEHMAHHDALTELPNRVLFH
ncbi:PAS-domain containing protein, partial [Klebsiella aerogenes]|uniref:PAS-domain containing protein n=1 Tax=Klebsiella aerogenes TaxID=548 RepID=UPI001954D438